MNRRVVRDVIVQNDLLDEQRLRELEALSAGSGRGLLETILDGGYVKEETLLPLIGERFGVAYAAAEELENPDPDLWSELPQGLRDLATFLPLTRDNGRVRVATSDLLAVETLDDVRQATGWSLDVRYAGQQALAAGRQAMQASASGDAESEPALDTVDLEAVDDQALEDLANEAPIIKLVNLIIMQAISEGASDIHVEPYEQEAVVRYRVDGVLREAGRYPAGQYPAIVSRLKIMADLDIAERRVPQDGRISIRLMDREYDLRVASVPVLFGEGIVLRILDKGSILLDLPDLGFSPDILDGFVREIRRPHGIVLVTGPTGSGKTTTLYASLSMIKSVETKMITVEDPVEYQLDGITQIHVNSKVGLTFAAGLRSILRLDPDVVMVGEIRDGETAEIAIRASLTGHTVFSTLHTNDATSAVTRMTDMGVAPFLISSALNAVLAQRLVRTICEFCKEPTTLDESTRALLASSSKTAEHEGLAIGRGCDECKGTGYLGRTGLHELYVLDEGARSALMDGASADVLRDRARAGGMKTMRDDGIRKVLAGVTTAEEVLRVTEHD